MPSLMVNYTQQFLVPKTASLFVDSFLEISLVVRAVLRVLPIESYCWEPRTLLLVGGVINRSEFSG